MIHVFVQVVFSLKDNLELLTTACEQEREKSSEGDKDSTIVKEVRSSVSVEQLINTLTSDDVLELIANKLTDS